MAQVVPSGLGPELAPGTRVGHYEIVGELGRGGLGVVYRARDATLDRDVALKSPLPERASEEDRHRFIAEARAASRLSHPGIVPIFEAFEDGNRPWLAMALADGSSLRRVIAERGALPLAEALGHAEHLADALGAAHAKHLLHRDVTPNNVFLTADGGTLLMDFGLARVFVPPGEESRAATGDGSEGSVIEVAGTPGYMAPEQWLARPLDVTADVFSLGAVIYEMCTGRPAFPGKNGGEILDATLHQDPPPVSLVAPDAPRDLDRIVGKALAKHPDQRYATARDLLVDLRALRRQLEGGGSGVAGRPFSRRVAWLLSAAALALVVWALWRPSGVPAGAPRQLTAAPGWETDPAISPDGSLVAYVAEVGGNVDIWVVGARGGDSRRLTDDPASDRSPAWFPDGRALAYVSDRAGGSGIWKVPRLGGTPVPLLADAIDPAVSPDGTQLAFARAGSHSDLRVFVAPLTDLTAARMITADGEGVWDHVQPAWSPDGTRISYTAQRDLWVVPSTGGGARRLTTDGEYDREPAWSPGGSFVYFSSFREGTLAIWRVGSQGGRPARVTMGTGPESHPSVSLDGVRLAYSTMLDTADIVVHDLATGAERTFGDLRDEESPVLSPDRRAVVFVSDRVDGRISLWLQPLSGEGEVAGPPRRLTDHPGTVSHPSLSPDGRWVAYHRVLDAERDIWIAPVSGGAPVQFTDSPGVDIHPDWSPDGRTLAWVSGRGGHQQIWVAPIDEGRPAGAARPLTDTKSSAQAPAWSPDATRLAFVMFDDRGVGDVWTVAAGGGPLVRVTRGARAWRVRWDRQTPGVLFVAAFWNDDRISVRRVAADGTGSGLQEAIVWIGTSRERIDFDVSHDGRLVVFGRQDRRGDLWTMEARRGNY